VSAFLYCVVANSGSPLVILWGTAAFFSGDCGTSEGGGRGGIIDCGFVFVAGRVGCVASLLRSSGICGVLFASLYSYTMAGFDTVAYLFFMLGFAGSVGARFVPSCVIIISSESPASVSCVWDVFVFSAFLGLLVPVWGLLSWRLFASLCRICSLTVFLSLFVPGVFAFPVTFAIGFVISAETLGVFFSNFDVFVGSLGAFSVGSAGLSDPTGVGPTSGSVVAFLILVFVRVPMEDGELSVDVLFLSLAFGVDGVSAV